LKVCSELEQIFTFDSQLQRHMFCAKSSVLVIDESALFARVRQGDAQALETLFRSFHARLCAFAFGYLQNAADAEEVVQDVFLSIWQKREEIEVRSSLRAYLFRAVRNRALNRSARARLEQRWLEEASSDDLELQTADPIDKTLEHAELVTRVHAAIAALPPGCRRVLQLRWQEQLSYLEIADALGISEKGVENQLARARKALKTMLADVLTR
jgi:RNA polymerase sigma-19 factor, ECF subfamily